MENPLKGRSIITSYLGGGWFFVFFLMIRDGNYGGGGGVRGGESSYSFVTSHKKKITFFLDFFHECCRDFKNLFKFVHCQLTLRCFFLAYATEIALTFIHVFIFAKKYLKKKGRSLRMS